MKKLLYAATFFFVIAMTCGNVEQAEAKTYKAGKFKYYYKNTKKGVWITEITPLSSKGISTLNIPARIKGKRVVKLGSPDDEKRTDLCEEYVPDLFGIDYGEYDENAEGYQLSDPQMYKRIGKIKKIKIPSSVTALTPRCFLYVQDGKEINIPKGVKKNVVYQFTRAKWKKLRISPNNPKYKVKNGCLLSKSGKTIYGTVYKKKKIVIPNTVTKFANGSYPECRGGTSAIHEYGYSGCKTMVIPKSVKKIPYLYSISIMKVKVDSANKYYGSKNGSLYNKKTGELITLYSKDGVYNIPKGVKVVDSFLDVFGKVFAKKVIIPSSVKRLGNILRSFFGAKNAVCVCYGKKPPILTDAFYAVDMNLTVYVPKGCKSAYEKAWKVDPDFEECFKVKFIELRPYNGVN